MRRRLFLDLDGVVADFDRHFLEEFGMPSQGLDDSELWGPIVNHGSFFSDLPMFDGTLEFFKYLETHWEVAILTACPKIDYKRSAKQKREWVRTNLSETVLVLPMLGGVNKPLFMQNKHDILVDDMAPNCNAWSEHGGHSILHDNFDQTRQRLNSFLQIPI